MKRDLEEWYMRKQYDSSHGLQRDLSFEKKHARGLDLEVNWTLSIRPTPSTA